MSEDFYKNSDNSRDGYKSHGDGNANGGRFNRSGRTRFNRNANAVGGYNSQRSEGGYRSRFDANKTTRSYSRRDNGESSYGQQNNEGGYRPRFNQGGNFQRNNENRWGKSRYGQNSGNGYAQRQQGGGYRSRFDNNNNQASETDGGFRPRTQHSEGYGRYQQNGGYRPRFQGGNGFASRPTQRRGYDPNAKYSQKKRLTYSAEVYDPNEPMRLNKFLANAGVCSRRDADKYIEAGVVSVNGTIVTELGSKVMRTDEVKFHDNVVKIEKKVYVLLNKPKGYVTTSDDPQNRKTVMDLVANACPERIYPVGRLDRNTTGVLLLTNDGELASKLTHPKFLKKKIYHVTTDQNVSAADIRQIAEGVTLEDGEIKADAVEYASETDKKQVGIEIHSGKNRIVRRIFESLGYHVIKLDRVYFAGLTKKNVRRGDWRYLTEKEVQMLRMGAFE